MEPRAEKVAIRAIVDDVLAEDESHKAKRKLQKDPDTKPKKSVRFKDVDDVHEFEVEETDNQVISGMPVTGPQMAEVEPISANSACEVFTAINSYHNNFRRTVQSKSTC